MKSFLAAVLAGTTAATKFTGAGSAATGISSVAHAFEAREVNDANNWWIEYDLSQTITMSAALASGDAAESFVCI